MNPDNETSAIASEAAEIAKPIDDLLAKQTNQMQQADDKIKAAEAKSKDVIRPARRYDEEEKE